MPGFEEEVASTWERLEGAVPPEMMANLKKEMENVAKLDVCKRVPQIGGSLPGFSLSCVSNDGKNLSLDEVLKENDFAFVTFYRGGWCPFCSVVLRQLQKKAQEFKDLKCAVVAICPQNETSVKQTTTDLELKDISVCLDPGMKYAEEVGAVFNFSETLKKIYQNFNIDLDAHNDNAGWKLPIAAGWVVDQNKKVRWAHTDGDWSKRTNPTEVIEALKGMK
eukprot:Nk52_evm37s222 gene=Nk52_evmTU37s222